MKRCWVVLVVLCLWLAGGPLHAKDLARQTAISKSVELGSLENSLHFFPDTLHFKAGKLYKLTLSNPSPVKHYFTSKDFADAIWTRKVDVSGVEVKGKISELELKPEAAADWVFVPLKAGAYDLKCTVPGHALAGMTGKLFVDE
ncbi:hypothetical protein [Synechococcus sp. PCC 7336]|uniref:hypothetical protein n=1 Tax=Synechococcus sp. PCC 7336 TaxID=195250 RepID=UPI000368878A|nr:hypothetical protein [Synechococcus sp. PCC 7336]